MCDVRRSYWKPDYHKGWGYSGGFNNLARPSGKYGRYTFKEAARKTVREAGDGTTTATVLAHSILTEAYKVADKTNSRELKEGINAAVKK